jgi:hypothetical protein
MLGLGLGFGKLSSYKFTVKKLIDDYIKRVTAAGGYLEGNECATAKVRELNSQRLLDNASWLLIPEGIKEDVVYAQKPTNGLGDLTFTRASDATRTNSAGVIERTPWNLLQSSEMFTTTWTQVRSTISANTITAPNGTLTADTIFDSVDNNIHYVSQTITAISGAATLSIYAKANQLSQIQVAAIGGTTAMGRGFDLSNGTTFTESIGGVSSNDLGQSITPVGNGWYRCTMSWTATGQTSIFILTSSAGAATYVGTGTNGLYIWGAQLVEGTDAKPYFATTNRQDVPRLHYRNADGTVSTCPRLLLEPQRTNSIRNSTMVGAVAGTTGTLPTNWDIVSSVGLTRTILGTGTENGLQYIDIRFAGTSTGTLIGIWYETVNQIAAVTGQTWSNSFYFKVISGSALSYSITTRELDNAGVTLRTASLPFTPTSTLQRFTYTRTNDGTGTAFVRPSVYLNLTNGATYDFTIRIAAPQMELGAYATTFIPTTTAAVTRLADAASKTGVSSLLGQTEGTLFAEVVIGFLPSTFVDIFGLGEFAENVFIRLNSSNQIQAVCTKAGTVTVLAQSLTITTGTYKIAFAYKNGDFALRINNNTTLTSTSTNVLPTSLAKINLGSSIRAAAFEGQFSQATISPIRLTNAQLAQLTA